MMHGQGKSDSPTVPRKSPNKAARAVAEAMEGRGGAKGNVVRGTTRQTQSWESVSPALDRIRETATRDKKVRFSAMLHHVTVDLLRWSFYPLSGCHPQPLAVVFGHAHGRSPAWQSSVPTIAPRVPATFSDDAACAAYLEKARWSHGFVCPHCQAAGEPFRFANRPGVLRCRKCRRDTGLTVGTVMARSHTPLSVWFWSAYLVSSQTPGVSAVQLRRQLGLSRYETAFQILHKLRAGMVRPDQDRIGGRPGEHVEVDETWAGGPDARQRPWRPR